MIINTGQRTDIPAFYSKWFMNRIKEGFVYVRNPYAPSLVTKYILDPKLVDVIGFCTKNPRPLFPYLEELKRFGQFWYITITGLGRDMEPNVPPTEQVIADFRYLSGQIGKNAIGWRYTPIIVNEKYTVEKHIQTFRKIAEQLKGYTHLAVFGFVDLYDKLKRNHPELQDANREDKIRIAQAFRQIARQNDMELRLCSKEKWLKEYGIDINGCMRIEDYEKAISRPLSVPKNTQARKGYCTCYLSGDIGAYHTCMHLCKYCYANGNVSQVEKNFCNHDPKSPFLIGKLQPNDQIRLAHQESWIRLEKTLFDEE